jgi:hypothetical protein
MLRLRITFTHKKELLRAIEEEMRRGVLLMKIAPPADLEFRAPLAVEIASPGGSITIDSEVLSILSGVGVGVLFPANRLQDARALLASTPEQPEGATIHEIVTEAPVSTSGPAVVVGVPVRATFAERVQLALHGTRDDRAAILRDQNKQLHPFVLKSPLVTPEEVASWAANAQMSSDFLKQIAERKEWLSRPAIALALARNPKTPAEIAVKAVDYVPVEALRQMAIGVGAAAHVVPAARRKIRPK